MSESKINPTLVYYDGWCNACIKAANLFTKLDANRSLIECIDIRSGDPRLELTGIDPVQLAASMHTRTPNGIVYSGPEAIRQAFTILGHHHAAAWTALPIIRPIVNVCYKIFARNRLRWFANHKCTSGVCNTDNS